MVTSIIYSPKPYISMALL